MKRPKDYVKLYDRADVRLLDRPKAPRQKPLGGWAYNHAAILADTFCDATGKRADVSEAARALISRAFKELAALVGVTVPAFAYTPRAWKQTRAAYIETLRAVRSLCQADGLNRIPHESDLGKLDRYTRTGTVGVVAAWLSTLLHRYWCADEFGKPVESQMWDFPTRSAFAEAVRELEAALEWAALIERYGSASVRACVDERDARRDHAVKAALASVPSVGELLRAQGAPDFDTALGRELGAEWKRFIAQEGGDN
jgi:hypothetical protein